MVGLGLCLGPAWAQTPAPGGGWLGDGGGDRGGRLANRGKAEGGIEVALPGHGRRDHGSRRRRVVRLDGLPVRRRHGRLAMGVPRERVPVARAYRRRLDYVLEPRVLRRLLGFYRRGRLLLVQGKTQTAGEEGGGGLLLS